MKKIESYNKNVIILKRHKNYEELKIALEKIGGGIINPSSFFHIINNFVFKREVIKLKIITINYFLMRDIIIL